ncbi:MAG: hypothetical protein WC551_10710 [Patescibacteria group bacterium]|jgi:hypothetical protein
MARVIQIIHCQSERGLGVPDNPCRIINQYFDFDGKLLWSVDEWFDRSQAEELAKYEHDQREEINRLGKLVLDKNFQLSACADEIKSLRTELRKRKKV